MSNYTVIGLQWGDEGKGKVVDALAGNCQYVVRYCGGANAGHSVSVNGERFALHLIPSGILHPEIHNCIGNGVVFDPLAALEEIDGLRGRGVAIGPENLHISSAAQVVMPWHKLSDRLAEEALGDDKIGTTARGIGPCYADKANRSMAIRVGDLLNADILNEKVLAIGTVKNAIFAALYGAQAMELGAISRQYAEFGRRLGAMIADTGTMLRHACAAGKPICFEGGQGSMLDIDHGTFPFVTSSSVTACGVPSGAGVSPKSVGYVVGVVKCYTSRVGAGPFPTEQCNAVGDTIRKLGREFGTTTGRPRRCGWFDAVAVKYAVELSGVDELAVMLMLDGPERIATWRICTGYKLDGKLVQEFDPALPLGQVECVYEDLPGWAEPIGATRTFEQLPPQARQYITRLEQLMGRPVGLISVGLGREQTILHHSKLK